MLTKFKHIVMADDDEDDQEMLLQAIKRTCPDISFTVADDGNTLLEILKTTPIPDIIILDINMPTLNGNECLKVIRSKNALKAIPVMMYSTSSNKHDIEESFLNGADYYIIKPNNFADLHQLGKDICEGTIKSSVKGIM